MAGYVLVGHTMMVDMDVDKAETEDNTYEDDDMVMVGDMYELNDMNEGSFVEAVDMLGIYLYKE